MSSNNASTPDPVGDGLFWAGIIVCVAAIVSRLATVTWLFFLEFWQVFALGGSTLLSTFFFVIAAKKLWWTLRDKPFSADVTIQEVADCQGEDDFIQPEDPYRPKRVPQELTKEQKELINQREKEALELQETLKKERILREQEQRKLLQFPIYYFEDMNDHDRYFLREKGYEEKEFVYFGKTRRDKFFIKKQKGYALEHTFVLYSLLQLLQDRGVIAQVASDSTLRIIHNNTKYALCVVTPNDHTRIEYLHTTAQRMSRYGLHCFLTTSSAYQRSFTRYAMTLTRNTIHAWIEENFPRPSPSPYNTTKITPTKPRKPWT